ncbi:snf2 super family [Nannochloropsis gaditana]|uniref:Snf2 super family n=1 Tax=Nannochloropsis gaditana TaxID=72520 RepID=W7TXY3_9STRA|nr:snf2 super family [Nannochloropsis gaditana]
MGTARKASKKRKSISDEDDSDFVPERDDDSVTVTEESSSSAEESDDSGVDSRIGKSPKDGPRSTSGPTASTKQENGRGRGRGRGQGRGRSGGNGGDTGTPKGLPPPGQRIAYKVEESNGKATCKKCNAKVPKEEIRIGLEMNAGRFGIVTRWQHLPCTIFAEYLESEESIEGYEYLTEGQQALVKKRVAESREEEDEDSKPIDASELVRKEWTTQREPPETLVLPILPYQKEGLGWMYRQEQVEHHGGILADEMGMGKTIQAIAVMLANRPSELHSEAWTRQEASHGRAPDPCMRAGTLVVCPLIALLQWQTEIARFTREGSLTVLVYHGSSREDAKALLQQADVVLTTYSIVEAEYRKMMSPEKVKCEDCGKRFYPDKLRLHKRYFCGEGAVLTAAQARTQRKGRSVKVGRLSKKSLRARHAQDDDETESDGGDSTVDDVKLGAVARTSKDGRLSKRVKSTKSKAQEGLTGRDTRSGAASSSGKDIKEDKYALIKAKNKKLMAEAMGGKHSIGGKKVPQESSKASHSRRKVTGQTVGENDKKAFEAPSEDGENESSSSSEEDEKYARIKAANKRRRGGKSAPASSERGGRVQDDSSVEEDSDETSSDSSEDEDVKPRGKATRSVIHELSWFRIILDEAHFIKTRSTSTAKAVFALTSLNKWCLTGTPLQNRVGELYSLVRFLRMDPHAFYFCRMKGCECKSLNYRFGPNWDCCECCGHTPMWHFAHFNRHILNPIQRAGYIGEGRKAFLTLKNEILDPILLRRTKETRSEDIMLPPRLIKLRHDPMDEREEDFYQALYTQSQAQFNTYLQTGTVLNNYAHIFDILIRLRQAVDHPYLVIHSHARTNTGAEGGTAGPTSTDEEKELDDDEEEECALCHEPVENLVRAECGCGFCRLCVTEYLEASLGGTTSCPECSRPLTVDLSKREGQQEEEDASKGRAQSRTRRQNGNGKHSNAAGTVCVAGKLKLQGLDRKSILHRIQLENFQTSTKLEALLEELYLMRTRDPSAKAIVFSQFVNMLDLIMWRLTVEGTKCHKLSGHMSVGARDKVLQAFKEDPEVKVLLISLKAGGVALNLTHANHIYLMDPWWNPAAEMQAIDRTHRIGQYKPIFATRFILENTIEERILKLQEKKQLVRRPALPFLKQLNALHKRLYVPAHSCREKEHYGFNGVDTSLVRRPQIENKSIQEDCL